MGKNLNSLSSICLIIIQLTGITITAKKFPRNPTNHHHHHHPRYYIKNLKSKKIIQNHATTFVIPEWPEMSCHEKRHQRKRNTKIHENVFMKVFTGMSPKLGLGEISLRGRPTSIRLRKCLEIKTKFDINKFSKVNFLGKWETSEHKNAEGKHHRDLHSYEKHGESMSTKRNEKIKLFLNKTLFH